MLLDCRSKCRRGICKPDFTSYSTLLHGMLQWDKTNADVGIYKEMIGIDFQVDERVTKHFVERVVLEFTKRRCTVV